VLLVAVIKYFQISDLKEELQISNGQFRASNKIPRLLGKESIKGCEDLLNILLLQGTHFFIELTFAKECI
jgi:hypothetical protein